MILKIKIIVFIIATAGIAWGTRKSLRSFRSHGLYRFLAFEAILTLILVNLDYWFEKPFGTNQVISWFLLIVSTFVVIHGAIYLRKMGKPNKKRIDPSLIGIEKTTRLVTAGAYRYIRHPIYSAGLFGTWGIFFKHLSWVSIFLAIIVTIFWTITARIEEAENIRFFGDEYRNYMKRTKMFIPFFF